MQTNIFARHKRITLLFVFLLFGELLAGCNVIVSSEAAGLTELGAQEMQGGDPKNALANYNKALALDPNYAMAYNRRGLVYLNQNDMEKALADYNKALELDPKLDKAYNNRGFVYLLQNDLENLGCSVTLG